MKLVLVMICALTSASLFAKGTPLFKAGSKVYTVDEASKENQQTVYKIENDRYSAYEQMAASMYLENFFNDLAKKTKTTSKKARDKYFKDKVKVSDLQVKNLITQLKDHPQLKGKKEAEKVKTVRESLEQQEQYAQMQAMVQKARSDGKIKMLITKPEQPVLDLKISKNDQIRYGPTESKPVSCKGDDCVTVVEYSGFQCPACAHGAKLAGSLMDEFKGKVRWIVRDFPLERQKRSKPAAVAAHCAGDQGKYWVMYEELYTSRKLSDSDFKDHAKKAKLNMKKFNKCVSSDKYVQRVEENLQSGVKNGVNGTPSFFVEGKKLGGMPPLPEFKRMLNEEIKNKKKG